jgi:hypothetical protein
MLAVPRGLEDSSGTDDARLVKCEEFRKVYRDTETKCPNAAWSVMFSIPSGRKARVCSSGKATD